MTIPCEGNACSHVVQQALPGPSIRLRNSHPNKRVRIEVYWASVLGNEASNTFEIFPGDDEIHPGPGGGFIGVSRIKANIL